jgi:hypothetical protein
MDAAHAQRVEQSADRRGEIAERVGVIDPLGGAPVTGMPGTITRNFPARASISRDEMTYHMLRMFGMNKRTAQRLSSGDLPDIPHL